AQAAHGSAAWRLHREPGIQRIDRAAAQEHARLGVARARGQGAAACRLQESRLRDRRRLQRHLWRHALADGAASGARARLRRAGHSGAGGGAGGGERIRRRRRAQGRADRRHLEGGRAPADRHGAGVCMSRPLEVQARDRLIVALDLASLREAETLIERLGDAVGFYKIGYQLAFEHGLPLAVALVGAGKRVFLDMKLHDIGNTVARAVEGVARMGATFLTVHAYPQTMRAAVAARRGSGLRILGVTVLTSYDDADLAEAGYSVGVEQLVAERAAQARD